MFLPGAWGATVVIAIAFEWGGRAKPVLGRLFAVAFAIGGRRDLNKLASLLESAAELD